MAKGLDNGQEMVFFQTQTSCFQFLLVDGAGSAQGKMEPFFLKDVAVKDLGTWTQMAGTVVW